MIVDPVFGAYLEQVVRQLAADAHLDPLELERRLEGVAEPPSEERDRRLFRLLDWIQSEIEDPAIGFAFGELLPITAFGTFSLGLPIAPTLRDGLQLIVDYHQLAMPLILFEVEVTGGETTLATGFRSPVFAGEAFLLATISACLDAYMARFTGQRRNLARVELAEASRGMEHEYRRRGIEAVVGGRRNLFRLDASLLDLASPIADRVTFEMLRDLCEQEAAALGRLRNAAELTRSLVMARIGEPPSLAELASRARLSVRQLRLALARHGSSYRRLVRECRIDYARELARNPDLSFAEIGYRLGYSDPAHFSAAFKRWTGKPPSDLRKPTIR